MKTSSQLRKLASRSADSNPGVAYDLCQLAERLATEEGQSIEASAPSDKADLATVLSSIVSTAKVVEKLAAQEKWRLMLLRFREIILASSAVLGRFGLYQQQANFEKAAIKVRELSSQPERLNPVTASADNQTAEADPGQQKEVSAKYAQLRTLIIRVAASDAAAKNVLLPILQVLKDQG